MAAPRGPRIKTIELFEPTIDDLIGCVEKELNKRRFVYPRQVQAGKMSDVRADREIFLMDKVLEMLKGLQVPALETVEFIHKKD